MAERRDGHLERVARARTAIGAATGAWAAKRDLAAALREFLAHLPNTAAPEDALRALEPLVRQAAAGFAAAGRAEAGENAGFAPHRGPT